MNKTTFAFSAVLSFLALGSSAALALPTVIPGTLVAPLANPPGVDDALQIFLNGSQVGGFPVTLSGEAACSDPASIGGCSFSLDQFNLPGGVVITPKASMANQLAEFYLPGTTTIDALFGLGCDGPDPTRNSGTGLCNLKPNFTIVTPYAPNPINLALLAGSGVSVGFTGTELDGGPTAFDLTNYITITGAGEGQVYTARLVVNNAPEPITLSLFGAGLVGAVAMRRRKQK